MQEFWTKMASTYGIAQDLEEKQRLFLATFLENKEGSLLELACGNGKVIEDIRIKNSSLNITGIDYNSNMIEVAKTRISDAIFMVGDVLELENILGQQKFDYVVCLNSLHNLPSQELIYKFFESMQNYTKEGGYIIFDIRNTFNPGVNYGYWKNRKKGLQFHTLNIFSVLDKFRENFTQELDIGITYSSIQETGRTHLNLVEKSIYGLYFLLTRIKIFAPYRFLIFRKK